jgi:DNA-binding MarR family transcriptional regulator
MVEPSKPKTLLEELRQSKPFESPEQEAILALQRTTDLFRRHFSELIGPHGISPQQYNVLRILRGAGTAGTPTLEIADRMVEKTPGITRLLDRLERKHLVRRRRCPEDRRQVLCWITESGLRLLAELDKPVAETGPRYLNSLSRAEVDQLIEMLGRIRSQLIWTNGTGDEPSAHPRASSSRD